MQRLFMANFAVTVDGQQRQTGGQLSVASSYDLWWSDRIPEQPSLVPSYVRLTDDFYREITERPVPVDLKALAHLRTVGPLALDVYSWLTYRTSYLSSRSSITWVQLRWQFGTQGGDSRSSRHSFRRDFRKALSHVLAVYPAAEADVTEAGVVLRPGRPTFRWSNRRHERGLCRPASSRRQFARGEGSCLSHATYPAHR
jgi:hypothetical protein